MDERAMELLKVFGLDEECDYKASNLPYGKQRKLEIARALPRSQSSFSWMSRQRE